MAVAAGRQAGRQVARSTERCVHRNALEMWFCFCLSKQRIFVDAVCSRCLLTLSEVMFSVMQLRAGGVCSSTIAAFRTWLFCARVCGSARRTETHREREGGDGEGECGERRGARRTRGRREAEKTAIGLSEAGTDWSPIDSDIVADARLHKPDSHWLSMEETTIRRTRILHFFK